MNVKRNSFRIRCKYICHFTNLSLSLSRYSPISAHCTYTHLDTQHTHIHIHTHCPTLIYVTHIRARSFAVNAGQIERPPTKTNILPHFIIF